MSDSTGLCADPRVDDHERRIGVLEGGFARVDMTMASMSLKMTELHTENRMRAEHQEREARRQADETRSMLADVGAKIDRLGSRRIWIGWSLVTTGVAFAYASAHLAGWMQ